MKVLCSTCLVLLFASVGYANGYCDKEVGSLVIKVTSGETKASRKAQEKAMDRLTRAEAKCRKKLGYDVELRQAKQFLKDAK